MCIKCYTKVQLSFNASDLDPEVERIAKLIKSGKLKPGQIDPIMVRKIAEELMKGVKEGYGNATRKSGQNFLNSSTENIYVFSGFKNHAMLQEASLLLKNEDGSIKPFKDFLADIKALNHTYNEVYLQAEYSNALASSQMAATWNDLKDNGADALTYRTANDDRVRTDHAILEGITRPMDDPFWGTYYPPNDWGCRCDVEPAQSDQVKPYAHNELPDIPPMFQNNTGKTGIIFPDTHPYYKVANGLEEKIKKQVEDIMPEIEQKFIPKSIENYEKKAGVTINKEIFSYLKNEVPLINNKKSAFYSPLEKVVNIAIDARVKRSKWMAESVVYHEYAHAADWQKGWRKSPIIEDLMSKYKNLFKANRNEVFTAIHEKIFSLYKTYWQANDFDKLEQLTATADTLMSLNYNFGFGHTKAYFKSTDKSAAEFIAHMFENKFKGNEVFKELMPELYEEMIKTADKLN
ncbi:MAG: minor capsid protein [Sphingobacteriales bacterium]|nr:minor capsid protein [Sphingobacteriales bacterium]